jgi:hypothetical protein
MQLELVPGTVYTCSQLRRVLVVLYPRAFTGCNGDAQLNKINTTLYNMVKTGRVQSVESVGVRGGRGYYVTGPSKQGEQQNTETVCTPGTDV